MMKTTIFLLLCIAGNLYGVVHTVTTKKALEVIRNATDEILVCINIDIHDLDQFYTQDFKETLKKARILCKHRKKEGFETISLIDNIMKTVSPLFIAAYQIAPRVIGVTKRTLRWANLIQYSCQQQGIHLPCARFLYAMEKIEPRFEDDYDFYECNGNIIYLNQLDAGKALCHYATHHPLIQGIIYVDTSLEDVTSCLQSLERLNPTVKALGLHVES